MDHLQFDPNLFRQNLVLQSQADKMFETQARPSPFRFDDRVAAVFDDMISRSVPLYKEAIHSLAQWAEIFYQDKSNIYDLGCSTGTTIEFLARHLSKPANFIGVDNSQPMLDRAALKLSDHERHQFKWGCSDLDEVPIENASVVIMNYTMQFLSVNRRQELLNRIFRGLTDNGLFFISEKIRAESSQVERMSTAIYETFKQSNGYSRTEIEKKKEALDNVLIPQTVAETSQMLRVAGFRQIQPILQWHNFVTMVAIK